MFKKLFGPKKFGGEGSPVSTDEIRNLVLAYFPKEGDINLHLSFDQSDTVNDGFEAKWEFYSFDNDTEGNRQRVLVKHTVFVDIRSQENAVFFKTRHFTRTKKPPKGEEIYQNWQSQVQIGKLETLKQEKSSRFVFYNANKVLEPLIEEVTRNGWDAYR